MMDYVTAVFTEKSNSFNRQTSFLFRILLKNNLPLFVGFDLHLGPSMLPLAALAL